MAAEVKCVRCGKDQPAEALIYSRHTKSHYCLLFAECDKRKARNDKKMKGVKDIERW